MRARALLLAFLSLACSAAQASCPDLPGAAALFEPSMPHIVWVGEMHGTTELPALFGDLVCLAGEGRHDVTNGERQRDVVVALERPHSEQPAWDRFLKDGDKAALTAQGMWSSPNQDGRSSSAMLALAERLRAFKTEGKIAAVTMIELDTSRNAEQREQGMADAVAEIVRDHPKRLVLVYTGNLHARQGTSPFDANLALAAGRLTLGQVTSIDAGGQDGADWSCQPGCGIHPYKGNDLSRGVIAARDPKGGYDFEMFTGVAMTPSPPVVKLSGK